VIEIGEEVAIRKSGCLRFLPIATPPGKMVVDDAAHDVERISSFGRRDGEYQDQDANLGGSWFQASAGGLREDSLVMEQPYG